MGKLVVSIVRFLPLCVVVLALPARLILDFRVVIGQVWRNRLFLQAFPGGRDRCGIFGKSRLISSA